MEPIKIRWETGHMEISPDVFFPTSTARIRKLLRVVALDFEHQDDIRMQLARACESRAQELKKKREFEATAEKLRQNAEVLRP